MAAEFRTRRGRIRPLAILLVSLLAVFSLLVAGIPQAAKVVLVPLVALAAWRALIKSPAHTVRLDSGRAPMLDGARGRLVGEAVTGLFVALKLTTAEGRYKRVFLFCDELESDDFRALLAYLRHG